ncbi:hypothetical protein TKK_0012485 [Trichogramma kaykai]
MGLEFKIPHNALGSLLHMLNKFTDVPFPKDPRTLLKTPKITTNLQTMGSGQYCHLGLENCVKKIIKIELINNPEFKMIRLMVNIDGAPIGNSSEKNFKPIQVKDYFSKSVHVVGIYYGAKKPEDPNSYLRQFVDEARSLVDHGFSYENKEYIVRIHGLIFDAPAKSFILGTKYHSGYHSCSKCLIEGSPAKLSASQIERISCRLENLKFLLPKDFNRRCRSLSVWKQWKATEFRHFLLYFITGCSRDASKWSGEIFTCCKEKESPGV